MRVLAVTAHPDDETLGAGGTLLKHRRQGAELHWFIATAAAPPDYDDAHIARQQEYVRELEKRYGMQSVHWARLPTGRLDCQEMGALIQPLGEVIRQVEPDCIYSVADYDVHTDHAVVFSALLTSVKAFKRPVSLSRILTYEVISSTDVYPWGRSAQFVPNVYSDITEFIDEKIEVMSVLRDELQDAPLPRSPDSIRALARYRGSTIGVEYAEAFRLVFEAF
jgi:LmbE family N-acetylglucosaminyl deacetylase